MSASGADFSGVRLWTGVGRGPRTLKAKRPWLTAVAVLGLFLSLSRRSLAHPRDPVLRVHFIDVGQGDGVLIADSAKRCAIVIDTADTRYPDSAKRFRSYVQEFLKPGGDIN